MTNVFDTPFLVCINSANYDKHCPVYIRNDWHTDEYNTEV